MAQITLTIPDDKITRVRDAFAGEFGWTPESGVTKTEFAKQQLARHVKNVVKNYEGNLSAGTARRTVENDVESITIT